MFEAKVMFHSMQEIEEFVNAATGCDCDVDAYYNHISLDAKSVLGLAGAGVEKEIVVKCTEPTEEFKTFIDKCRC